MTQPALDDRRGRRDLVLTLATLPAWLAACTRAQPAAAIVDLVVESDGDLLEFKPKELRCASGAHVRLTFHHAGRYISQEHNWVLILPHTFDAITKAALAAGETNGWVPRGDARVLAATRLCGKGEIVSIEFIAPAPGDYPYICSNPGHAESMWGVLHVTAA